MRDLQFKVDFEQQIFEQLFHGNFIYLRIFARNLLRDIIRTEAVTNPRGNRQFYKCCDPF